MVKITLRRVIFKRSLLQHTLFDHSRSFLNIFTSVSVILLLVALQYMINSSFFLSYPGSSNHKCSMKLPVFMSRALVQRRVSIYTTGEWSAKSNCFRRSKVNEIAVSCILDQLPSARSVK